MTSEQNNYRERLERIQQRLEERGVTDVKFVWGNISEKPLSRAATEIAVVLEAYLDGILVPLTPFNDHPSHDEQG